MQIRKQITSNKVFFHYRHFIATDILEERLGKLDRKPPAAHKGTDAELLRQAKLEIFTGTQRRAQAEITIVEGKKSHRVRAA
jgi:hypothetical protein